MGFLSGTREKGLFHPGFNTTKSRTIVLVKSKWDF